jgi:glutamine amidotransferase
MNAEKQIIIVDYGMGNLHSLQTALSFLKVKSQLTSDHDVIRNADSLILPGVGSFTAAMKNINARGLKEPIQYAALERRIPLLGICLGMQLLATEGEEEGPSKGLDLISGKVVRFTDSDLRLPHIGFNSVKQQGNTGQIFEGIEDNADFYFVHSYHFEGVPEENVIGNTMYGKLFPSVVRKENIYGMQFHPEKSQSNGLKVLSNFIHIETKGDA